MKVNQDEQLLGFAYFDVMLQYCVLVLFFFMLTILMPHKKSDAESAALAGRVCAELYWDNSRNIDLDLWGKGPDDKDPVFYHAMHSKSMDLMRDVIGFANNPEHLNMEIICANKLHPGSYTFNVKYFGNVEPHLEGFHYDVDATMIIRVQKDTGTRTTLKRTVTMHNEKEQRTVFNFRVDEYGNLIQNSINFEEVPL